VKIDGLLHWAPGSCLHVLEGGEPTKVGDMGGHRCGGCPEVAAAEGRHRRGSAGHSAAGADRHRQGHDGEEIREMSERVVRDLRERGLI
jgi:hypothetical protein